MDVGFYWALLRGTDGVRSARLFSGIVPQNDTFMLGGIPRYYVDVEGVGLTATQLTLFLAEWERLRPNAVMGIYTSRYFWQEMGGTGLIGTGHAEFARHPLWVADYRSGPPALPDIWKSAVMHQFRYKAGYLPGYTKDLDISEVMMNTPSVDFGSKIGTHAINPGETIPLALKAKANGYRFPVMKIVNDGSVCVSLKQIDPKIITICRYINPNAEWESLQNVGSWGIAKMQQFARESIKLILDRTPADQLAATDYWAVENEPNPRDEANGYRNIGLALIELVKEANNHGLKLALPAFPQGCPEWNAGDNALGGGMIELAETGLFGLMKAGGHILDVHEGVFTDQPITFGYGDLIPRAPFVFGAGSTCFRHRYLYHLLEQRNEVVPLVISEFYGGGRYTEPPEAQLEKFVWYDKIARTEPYLLGFLGFTIGPNSDFQDSNYTNFYLSTELDGYMHEQALIPNVEVPMDTAKILANATTARDASQVIINEINASGTVPLYNAKVLIPVTVRDAAGNSVGFALTVGTTVSVYAEHIMAGPYSDRAKINLNGNNVVMTSNGLSTLQKV